MKYFSYEFKKATNLWKLYILSKIHEKFHSAPGRLLISNSGISIEICLEFLDYPLKPTMPKGWSYMKDSDGFINKSKNHSTINDNAVLVNSGPSGLYPRIPNKVGLRGFK